MKEFLVGSCELQLSRLQFVAGRDPKESAVAKLSELFRLSCDPEDHYIPVVVCPDELQAVLDESAVSIGDIVRGQMPLPRLTPSNRLRSIHARQRYEAAIRVFGQDMWWAVRVYCIPTGSDILQVLPKEVDQYYYQTPPTDGEVFLKVRDYEESGNPHDAALWRLRLSPCKQEALRAIERRANLLEKLDQLRVFPGLWEGFQLGNIHKYIALHAMEEVLHYLQHVYDVWSRITLHDPAIQRATNWTTVKQLELRTPAVSHTDAVMIQDSIRSGQLFRGVNDLEVRSMLQHVILQTSVLVPSIGTFHENMKLLTIGMMILRDHIIDKVGTRSVRAAMKDCWEPPERCVIECRENVFHDLDLRPTVEIAYRQVFMAALRHFPHLSTTCPRREKRQKACIAAVDDSYLASFLHGARRQGFRSNKLEASIDRLRNCPTLPNHIRLEARLPELLLKRRCGRPFARSHSALNTCFFLPDALRATRPPSHPCTLFVHEDFMCAFFGQHPDTLHSLITALRRDPRTDVRQSEPQNTAGIEPATESGVPRPIQATDHPVIPLHTARITSSGPSRIQDGAVSTFMDIDAPSLDELSGPNGSISNEQSARAIVNSTYSSSSSRSLIPPEHLGYVNERMDRAGSHSFTRSLRVSQQDVHGQRSHVSPEAVSPLWSSQGIRSMHLPQQWLTSIHEEPIVVPIARGEEPFNTDHPLNSPETSLPSSGTSFSSRSLTLPQIFRDPRRNGLRMSPDYIRLRGRRGNVPHSPQPLHVQSAHWGRSWRTDSSRSEDSARSIFGPQESSNERSFVGS